MVCSEKVKVYLNAFRGRKDYISCDPNKDESSEKHHTYDYF